MVRPVALPVDVEALAPLAETMLRPSSYPFDFERDNLPPKPTSDRMGPIAFPRGGLGGVRGSKPPASFERGQERVSRREPASGLQLGAVFLDRLCKSAIDS